MRGGGIQNRRGCLISTGNVAGYVELCCNVCVCCGCGTGGSRGGKLPLLARACLFASLTLTHSFSFTASRSSVPYESTAQLFTNGWSSNG